MENDMIKVFEAHKYYGTIKYFNAIKSTSNSFTRADGLRIDRLGEYTFCSCNFIECQKWLTSEVNKEIAELSIRMNDKKAKLVRASCLEEVSCESM